MKPEPDINPCDACEQMLDVPASHHGLDCPRRKRHEKRRAAPPSALARVTTSPLASREPLTPTDVMRAFWQRRSPNTVAAYRADLKHFASYFLPKYGRAGVDLNALAAWLFEQGPGPLNAHLIEWVDEHSKRLAPFTVNRRLSALRSLIKLGRTLGLINWTLDVQGVRGARGVRDMRGPVKEEITKLFAAAQGPYETALLYLLYVRGLRSVEVRELKMKHINWRRNEVMIRGKGQTGLQPVTVSQRTMDALGVLSTGLPENAYVFSLRTPEKMVSHVTLWSKVKKVGVRCGVQVRPHGLRHSAITAVLDANNGDIRRTAKFSRHKNINVLMGYDDSRQDFGGEATKALDEELP